MPGALEAVAAERVGAGPDEAMPPAHGEAKLVFHPLAEHDSLGVVPAVAHRPPCAGLEAWAFVAQRFAEREEAPRFAGGRQPCDGFLVLGLALCHGALLLDAVMGRRRREPRRN